MRTPLFPSMLVAIAALAACEKAGGPKPPEVTLEQTGGGNLAPLRLAPTEGEHGKLAIVMKMGLSAQGRDITMPAITMSADAVTSKIEKNGDFTADVTFGAASVADEGDAAMVSAMRASLAKLDAFGATTVMTPRGLPKKVTFALPPGADAQFEQMADSIERAMGQLTPALPEEPVGVGAKWKVSQVIDVNGVKMEQVADYAMISRAGDKVELDVQVTGGAKPQTVHVPGGASAKLDTLTATGDGHLSLDLAHPFAITGKVTSHVDMTLSAQGQDVAMSVDMDIEFHPAP